MKKNIYKNKENIKESLTYFGIKKYEIIEDSEYGYVVNVKESVDISNYVITNEEIKIKFNIIEGNFDCSYNLLKDLDFCPKIIKGNFKCNNNLLTSLKGIPNDIRFSIDCSYNLLKNLEYCPKIIKGDFYCNNNKVNTLEYFPERIHGICDLSNNIELGEIQNKKEFEELYLIHKNEISSILNKKLEKEITIDNSIKNAKIKL